MNTCPRCALINPPSAEVCDCGFRFTNQTAETIQAEMSAAEQSARRGLVRGLVVAAIGLVLSIISFIVTKPGGYFFVASGALVGGLGMAGRGWSKLIRLSQAKREGGLAHSDTSAGKER